MAATSAQGVVLDLSANATAVQALLSQPFDYVVVGGGTAGLAVASRLAASNTSLSVLVLEAGERAVGNPGVDVPGLAGSTFTSSIDWGFGTTAQENADGRSIYWPRGKVLGGTSAINFLVDTRPNKAEQDQWASLSGDSSWSFSSTLPFYKKSEYFFAPGVNTQNETVAFTPSVHGTTGAISVSYPPYMAAQFAGFDHALRDLGVPVAQDLSSGDNHGVSYAPSTMHNAGNDRTRSYAVDYLSIAPTLNVITGAHATKINWKTAKDAAGNVVASSVSFVQSGRSSLVYTANVTREVILSAGTVQTPQLLELSGVGSSAVLTKAGVKTVVDLPGVGENLQDHPAVVDVFKLKPGVESLDQLQDSAFLSSALAEFAAGQGILTEVLYPLAYLTLTDFTASNDSSTIAQLGSQASNPTLPTQLWNAAQSLYKANVPVMEMLSINVYFGNSTGEPGQGYISLAGCLQHSLSRGGIHIASSDPLAPPTIDPNYLQSPLDLFLLKRAGQFLRKVAAQPALAQYIESEAEPGVGVQSEQEWEEWVKSVVRTEYHPVGTASLLPRASGGVVSPQLKVYGTANVRVVDVSVVPLHVSSHPTSMAYMIGEKAAAMILAGK
ncbi:hypothetical protein JCM8097_004225 [Rhodosporidiobolus ruineniae]